MFMNVLLMILLMVTSIFLILLVLVQRGRGGGLAGAFGGLGGQSAFGTKAGDLFTRITIGVAAFWIILCAVSVKLLNEGNRSILSSNLGPASATERVAPGGDSKSGKAEGDQAAPSGKAAAGEGASGTQTPAAPAATAPANSSAPAESK